MIKLSHESVHWAQRAADWQFNYTALITGDWNTHNFGKAFQWPIDIPNKILLALQFWLQSRCVVEKVHAGTILQQASYLAKVPSLDIA